MAQELDLAIVVGGFGVGFASYADLLRATTPFSGEIAYPGGRFRLRDGMRIPGQRRHHPPNGRHADPLSRMRLTRFVRRLPAGCRLRSGLLVQCLIRRRTSTPYFSSGTGGSNLGR